MFPFFLFSLRVGGPEKVNLCERGCRRVLPLAKG